MFLIYCYFFLIETEASNGNYWDIEREDSIFSHFILQATFWTIDCLMII